MKMDKFPKTKIQCLVSLMTKKHSAQGKRSIVHRIAVAHLDKLSLQPDDVVLDVGCGTGDETVIVATGVKRVVGIDIFPDILEIARRDFPADNVDYQLEDLADTSANTSKWRETFDKVISFDRVMMYPEPEQVFRNMIGCLKPGGELLCAIPNSAFNFFEGAMKIIKENPKLDQATKKERNFSLWKKTESEAEEHFKALCEWSYLSCKAHQFVSLLSKERCKMIWLDSLERVERVDTSEQNECLEAVWQWAKTEYEIVEDGCIKKPSEFMIVHGVKKV